jgi:hypothetical protein
VPHANPDPLPSLDALPPMPMTPTRARPSYGSYGSYGSEFLPLTPLRPLPFSPASLHPSPRPGPESGLQPSVHDRCLEGQRILDRLASMACDETPGEIWRQIKASQSPTEATYHLDRLKDYESQCVQF